MLSIPRTRTVVSFLLAAIGLSCGGAHDLQPRPARGASAPPAVRSVTPRSATGRVIPAVSLDRARVLARDGEDLFVLIGFEVPHVALRSVERVPINLALVIDRSGSMEERGKLTYAVEASRRLIDAMAPTDALGVVEYDDRITVLWPSSPLRSPALVKQRIAGLTPRGSTNLAGGLLSGLDEVARTRGERGIDRVLLLSDGLANQGITDPTEIAEFVSQARRRGISVSTIGLGLDYNEDLMQAIAEAGGGNYYYVESPTQVDAIFQRELSTLFTTVAMDVRLRFDALGPVRAVSVVGHETTAEDGGVVVRLENLYAGEKRSILLKLTLDARKPGPLALGALQLDYTDNDSGRQERSAFDLTVVSTADSAAVAASTDRATAAEATLLTTEQEHVEYIRQYERGEKEEALGNISALNTKVARLNSSLKDVRLAKKLEQLQLESDDMAAADRSPEYRSGYLKGSKQRLYLAQKGKRGGYLLQQHDNGFEVKQLQEKLAELKLYRGAVDGLYDEDVVRAVEQYQRQIGIPADGVAGPITLKALRLY